MEHKPVMTNEDFTNSEVPPSRRFTAGKSKTTRVLVVDDDPLITRMVSRILAPEQGFDTVAVNDSRQALKLVLRSPEAARRPFDVIVTDIAMPGINGLDLVRVFSCLEIDVPLVLITAFPKFRDIKATAEEGVFCCLTKPISQAQLADTVAQAAAAHREVPQTEAFHGVPGPEPKDGDDLVELNAAFESALASLWMAFQPIVRAKDGALVGYEALMRSEEPRLPDPGAVLAAAERLDRLPLLGRTTRELAARSFAGAPADALLFLNLHPHDLVDEQLGEPAEVLTSMSQRVVLEIIERSTLINLSKSEEKVRRLQRLGFRIAVDDLGAGYAGLTKFAALKPNIVKLDRSLISGIDASHIKQGMVRSFVKACRGMGIATVAEGIETEAERRTCTEIGCDLLQGYLIARPGRPFPELKLSW